MHVSFKKITLSTIDKIYILRRNLVHILCWVPPTAAAPVALVLAAWPRTGQLVSEPLQNLVRDQKAQRERAPDRREKLDGWPDFLSGSLTLSISTLPTLPKITILLKHSLPLFNTFTRARISCNPHNSGKVMFLCFRCYYLHTQTRKLRQGAGLGPGWNKSGTRLGCKI